MSERCANTEALNQYLAEQEVDENAQENFLEEIEYLTDEISSHIEDIKSIAKKYEDYDFTDVIKETIGDLI